MVCAILRSVPKREYLELEDQPAISVVYTFMLEMHRNRIIAYLKCTRGVV